MWLVELIIALRAVLPGAHAPWLPHMVQLHKSQVQFCRRDKQAVVSSLLPPLVHSAATAIWLLHLPKGMSVRAEFAPGCSTPPGMLGWVEEDTGAWPECLLTELCCSST